MKRLILCGILLLPLLISAQDYQTVRSDFVHFFLDENGNDHGMRMDSIGVEGADSVLISYLTLRYPDYGVIDAYVPSWLGTKTVIKPNGDNLFFNNEQDTILLKTQAQLNDNWNLFTLDSASYLEGAVTDISSETILNSAVNIKTITLQRKDYSNNPLGHPLNGKTIKISETLGIVKGFDFYLFPEDTIQIEIAGMENSDVGIHRLTRDEVYDFQVGDEFHYMFEENPSNPSWEKRIERVMSVDNSVSERKIIFEVWKWAKWFDGQPGPNTEIIESSYYADSTIIPNVWLSPRFTEGMPNEASVMFDTTEGYGFYTPIRYSHFASSDIPALTFQGDYNPHYEADSLGLWTLNQNVSGWGFRTAKFADGIGRTYWTHQVANGAEYIRNCK